MSVHIIYYVYNIYFYFLVVFEPIQLYAPPSIEIRREENYSTECTTYILYIH